MTEDWKWHKQYKHSSSTMRYLDLLEMKNEESKVRDNFSLESDLVKHCHATYKSNKTTTKMIDNLRNVHQALLVNKSPLCLNL